MRLIKEVCPNVKFVVSTDDPEAAEVLIPNAEILSAPSSDPNSAKGKLIWCKRELNPQPVKVNLVPAKDKHIFAKPNHILIDDKDKNIQQWIEKGGIGILHTDTKSTIEKVQTVLGSLKEYGEGGFFIGQMNIP
jgi:hypothetical protein